MKIKWCTNMKDNEVFSYHEYDNGDTDFPRGLFLVGQDYIVTGFRTEQEARAWFDEWEYIPNVDNPYHGIMRKKESK